MLWHENLCRICLCGDSKMYTVAGTEYQDVYEKITGSKWVQVNRPAKICYVCKSQLRRALKFKEMSKKSDEIFEQMLAVGFEFTEEILPILNKRSFKTVEITPLVTLVIEPRQNIKQEESATTRSALEACRVTSANINSYVPNEGASDSTSRLQNLGRSPMQNNIYSFVHAIDDCEDDIKIEIKTLDESNTEGSPEKIFRPNQENSSPRKSTTDSCQKRKSPCKESQHGNTSINKSNYRSSSATLIDRNALVYIPSSEITVLSSDENNKVHDKVICLISDSEMNGDINKPDNAGINSNKDQNDKAITRSKTTPDSSISFKNLTLTYTPNHVITPRKRLENVLKKKSVLNKTSLNITTTSAKKKESIKKTVKYDRVTKNKSNHTTDKHIEKSTVGVNGKGPYVCDICDRTFSIKKYLALHMKSHGSDRSFQCQTCSKDFTRLSYLNKHVLRTHGNFMYKCDTCEKTFKQSCHLTQHKRTHTGEKPYACIQCKQRFRQLSNLIQHKRLHSGEKPYSCFCGKSFRQKSGLDQHTRVHLDDKPFKCDYCSKAYHQKSNLLKHVEKNHEE